MPPSTVRILAGDPTSLLACEKRDRLGDIPRRALRVEGRTQASGVVLSAARLASDLDFELTVLSDCCADPGPEVQKVLMEKVLPFQATVVSSDQWASALR